MSIYEKAPFKDNTEVSPTNNSEKKTKTKMWHLQKQVDMFEYS